MNGHIVLSDTSSREVREPGDLKSKPPSKSIVCNGDACDSNPGKFLKDHTNSTSNSSDVLSSMAYNCSKESTILTEGLSNLALNGVEHQYDTVSVKALKATSLHTEANYLNPSSKQKNTASQLDSSRSSNSQECIYVSHEGNKKYGKGNLAENNRAKYANQKCVIEFKDPNLVQCCDSSTHLSNPETLTEDTPSGPQLDHQTSAHAQVSQEENCGENYISSGKLNNALDNLAKDLNAVRTSRTEIVTDSTICEAQDRSDSASKTTTDTGATISQSDVTYVVYESELNMPDIIRLIQKDLSEPYSIYTYRYFIHNWPYLCFMAKVGNECVGAIVCKLDYHKKVVKRGYIAMLAVDSKYRKLKIGSTLVRKAIEAMIAEEADEVVLETEITNRPALRLYENLGFVRDKRLFRYYLNGVDALRLKLWLR